MKTFILALSLISCHVFALPVFNQNMAAEGTLVTIWPDHIDPNHFYFAPNLMKLSMTERGIVKFNLTKYFSNCRFRLCNVKALLNAFFIAGYKQDELKIAQDGILKRFPKAIFSPIPYISSRVEFGNTLDPFIDQEDCSPIAGQASDEVPCSLTLNGRGIKTLIPRLNEGKVFPFKFYYKISGVLNLANDQYKDYNLDYAIVVNLGSEMLINHEDLVEE